MVGKIFTERCNEFWLSELFLNLRPSFLHLSICPLALWFLFSFSSGYAFVLEVDKEKAILNFPLEFLQDTSVIISDSSFVIGESGFVAAGFDFQTVNLKNSYNDPVIITGGIRRVGGTKSTIRIRNVSSNQFDIKLRNWECWNVPDEINEVPYVVIEAGIYMLPNGKKLIAKNYSGITDEWKSEFFPEVFPSDPIIFGQTITFQEPQALSVQFDYTKIDQEKFSMRLLERRSINSAHGPEKVSIVALEKGFYIEDEVIFETSTENFQIPSIGGSKIPIINNFVDKPVFLSSVQTSNYPVASIGNYRYSNYEIDSVTILLDAETCSPIEDGPVVEGLAYWVLKGPGDILAAKLDTIIQSNLPPVAGFSFSPDSGAAPLEIAFNAASSSDPDGSIVAYSWDFGDGATASGIDTVHTYTQPGNFTVTLIVTDNDGNRDTATASIQVDVPNQEAPVANMVASVTPGGTPYSVTFNGSSSFDADGTIVSYEWDFGDGNVGTGISIQHTYTTAGEYTATLIVTDDDGLKDTTALLIQLETPNLAPVAMIVVAQGEAPLSVIFSGKSSFDPDGTLVSFSWDFGDGNMGVGDSVQHAFTVAGEYTATLIVTDNDGLSDTTTVLIQLENPNGAPVAIMEATPTTGNAPLEVDFNGGLSVDSDGVIVSYEWSFGEGNVGAGASIQHTYTSVGEYTATLIVTDDDGLSDTATLVIQVIGPNSPPTASFTATPTVGIAPLNVSFDASASSDPDGSIISFFWEFGDGGTASGISAEHTYTNPGMYTASLYILDNEGAEDTFSIVIEVLSSNRAPIALFSVTPSSGNAPLEVELDGSISVDPDGEITAYIWDFGDGSSGTGQQITHTYQQEGIYIATLEVTDNEGAKNTLSISIRAIGNSYPDTLSSCPDSTIVIGETGSVLASENEVVVLFQNSYQNPVIITGGIPFGGPDQTLVQVAHVTQVGFTLRLNSWSCESRSNVMERINYLVVEAGNYTMPDGSQLVAGNYNNVDHNWNERLFTRDFPEIPIVFAQAITQNGSEPVIVQVDQDALDEKNFSIRLRGTGEGSYLPERVSVIAWESGLFTEGDYTYEMLSTPLSGSVNPQVISLQETYGTFPVVLGAIQSAQNERATVVNYEYQAGNQVRIGLNPESCGTSEISTLTETVNFVIFKSSGKLLACARVEGSGSEENGKPGGEATTIEGLIQLKLAPVPANEVLTVEAAVDSSYNHFYEIVNYAGQRVKEGFINGGKNPVDIQDLSRGLYMIRVYNTQSATTAEFVRY